jgi:hypothetical protein
MIQTRLLLRGNKLRNGIKSQQIRRYYATFFTLFILVGILLISSLNTSAIDIDIKVAFEKRQYNVHYNGTYLSNVSIQGNVSCEISGVGETFQYVTVVLYADDKYGWDPGVGPSAMEFYSSGKKSINVSFNVDPRTLNHTVNNFLIHGQYYIEPSYPWHDRSTGDIRSGAIDVKLIKKVSIEDIDPEFDSTGNSGGFFLKGVLFFVITILLILAPVIIITLIIYFKKFK